MARLPDVTQFRLPDMDANGVAMQVLSLTIRAKKCHEFETDLGDIAVRQPRKPRSNKINMSREVRPYSARAGVVIG